MLSGTGLSCCLAQGKGQLWQTILWFCFPSSFPCRSHCLLNHCFELLLVLPLAASSQLMLCSQGCSQAHPPCSAPVGTVPLPCKESREGAKGGGEEFHSISQLPAMLKKLLARNQGRNHLHSVPQPWLTAVGAPASAIIWKKDPFISQEGSGLT